MKKLSRINFKKAQNYPLKYILELVGSLANIDKPNKSTNTLNNYIYKHNNQLLNEVILFQSERSYHITNLIKVTRISMLNTYGYASNIMPFKE